jgi:ubiquinone/menaquinone biosynthesis C-methylase UbiE
MEVLSETSIGPYEVWRREILKKKISKGDFLILDVGCGRGTISEELTNNNTVIGLDVCEIALKEAAVKGIEVKLWDIDKGIPFENSYFDIVLVMDVLEHILEPEHLFDECKRVLKNKGLLIISVPNMLNLLNRFYFFCGIFKDITDINHKQNLLFSEHIRVFSKKVLEKLIEKKGLVCISKDYYFPQHISEEPWKRLSLIGRCIYYSGLFKILPSLFSRNFLFVCVKK